MRNQLLHKYPLSGRHRVSALVLVALTISLTCIAPLPAAGDLVTLSTSAPTGVANRNSNRDFVGILNSVSPTQVNGGDVEFNNVPGGEAFAIGDLVGRDMNASGGGRIWEYQLALPVDARPGSGFSSIFFSGHAFERSANNLGNLDQLTWDLFVNNVLVDSGGTPVGEDFDTFDINLSDVGGNNVSQVRVVFTVNGFDGGNDWFATRGLLQANYFTIPEPSHLVFLGVLAVISIRRRRDM